MKPLGSQLIAEFINCSEDILNDKPGLERVLSSAIDECGLTLITINGHQFEPVGVTVVAVIGESHVCIHTYPEARHASIDIFTCSNGSHAKARLLDCLKEKLGPTTVRTVALNRGNPLEVKEQDWITSCSSIGYETRYHIQKYLVSTRSKYQQIDVIENDDFGRMLFLDRDLQIAEKDAHVYNACLVGPILDASGPLRRVAILGGGDGGVLSEVVKHDPEAVFLVDIDAAVIDVSKQYLSCICKDAFEHPSAIVRVEDANRFLDTHKGFDAIIYDLTMYPEALTDTKRNTFLEGIFSKINSSLAPGGIATMQCCSEHDNETRLLLDGILPRYFEDVVFDTKLVPSFCENWIFARATAKKTSPGNANNETIPTEEVFLR